MNKIRKHQEDRVRSLITHLIIKHPNKRKYNHLRYPSIFRGYKEIFAPTQDLVNDIKDS